MTPWMIAVARSQNDSFYILLSLVLLVVSLCIDLSLILRHRGLGEIFGGIVCQRAVILCCFTAGVL